MGADPLDTKASQSGQDTGLAPPKKGETYRCSGCGMEIQVTADCHCKEGEHVHFHCCGKELTKV